jgi:hypothetical protein
MVKQIGITNRNRPSGKGGRGYTNSQKKALHDMNMIQGFWTSDDVQESTIIILEKNRRCLSQNLISLMGEHDNLLKNYFHEMKVICLPRVYSLSKGIYLDIIPVLYAIFSL